MKLIVEFKDKRWEHDIFNFYKKDARRYKTI